MLAKIGGKELELLANRTNTSAQSGADAIANAAVAQIDSLKGQVSELQQYKSRHEAEEWPTFNQDKEQQLHQLFSGIKCMTVAVAGAPSPTPTPALAACSLTIFCNDDDCTALADQIDGTAKNAGWKSDVAGGTIGGIGEGLVVIGNNERPGTGRVRLLARSLHNITGLDIEPTFGRIDHSDFAISIGRKPRSLVSWK